MGLWFLFDPISLNSMVDDGRLAVSWNCVRWWTLLHRMKSWTIGTKHWPESCSCSIKTLIVTTECIIITIIFRRWIGGVTVLDSLENTYIVCSSHIRMLSRIIRKLIGFSLLWEISEASHSLYEVYCYYFLSYFFLNTSTKSSRVLIHLLSFQEYQIMCNSICSYILFNEYHILWRCLDILDILLQWVHHINLDPWKSSTIYKW